MKLSILKYLTTGIISLLFLTGCYTQLHRADRNMDNQASGEYEEYYVVEDTVSNQGVNIHNYYFGPSYGYGSYGYDPYYYGNRWYDPWYWNPTPRWGLYVSFSTGWWDPYWYPWGWHGRGGYPFVSAYPGHYYNPYFWNPYHYGYGGGYYSSKDYKKRPFNRRSEIPPRRITRGEGSSGAHVSKASDTRRIIQRDPRIADNTRTSEQSGRRVVRSEQPVRVLRSSDAKTSARQVRSVRGASSSQGRSVINRDRNTDTRRIYKRPSRSSSSKDYRSNRSSSRSSSRSAVRSSSGSRSSSSAKRSSSGSSNSSSSKRKAKRK